MRTDKHSLGYSGTYRMLAREIGEHGAVLEIGVAGGGSLEFWQALFPEGVVTGVDNNAEYQSVWPEGTNAIVAGQDDPRLPALVSAYAPEGYDLIVDDASHSAPLSERTLELLWPLVKPGGWYVLEDWTVGLESSPHYPYYGYSTMVYLAKSLIERIKPSQDMMDLSGVKIPAGAPGSVDEIRYRYGLACLHKLA